MADEMKVLREQVNKAYALLLAQRQDDVAKALVEAMTRTERAVRAAPVAQPGDDALLNEIELYMDANANVSEQCADFLERLVKRR